MVYSPHEQRWSFNWKFVPILNKVIRRLDVDQFQYNKQNFARFIVTPKHYIHFCAQLATHSQIFRAARTSTIF